MKLFFEMLFYSIVINEVNKGLSIEKGISAALLRIGYSLTLVVATIYSIIAMIWEYIYVSVGFGDAFLPNYIDELAIIITSFIFYEILKTILNKKKRFNIIKNIKQSQGLVPSK